ncbi:glycosyl hydrolase catalytic core-domain-containing protein [Cerioporus squamosus]|nr:glycosyl hydrolase catalytic core-domain-containing protein [Cerioporus squamosus]
MASKLLNLVALSSLAVLAVTFGPASTNALSTGHSHMNRHIDHAPIAKRKRDNSKRCKVRSSTLSSEAHSSTAKAQTTSAKALVQPSSTKAATTKAPAKTTSSSIPASTGGSGAAGSGKFGQKGSKICLAYADGNDVATLKAFKTDHVVGLYDWSVEKPDGADDLGYDFWPMLWGGGSDKISAFEKAMSKPKYGTIVLGFNEPNEQGQSNMDPQTAASLWKQHIEPQVAKGYKTCSPAMSSRPNGKQWMQDFMKACDGCTVDYQCLHWYDIGFDTLKTYLEEYHNLIGLPILLTEFAEQNFNGGAQASQSEIFAFMGQTLKFVDETDWLMAACPFGIMHDLQGVNELNLLQSSSGGPTDLGRMVINNSY